VKTVRHPVCPRREKRDAWRMKDLPSGERKRNDPIAVLRRDPASMACCLSTSRIMKNKF
jgi:hypothetical protein